MSMAYIRKRYGVPAKRGAHVVTEDGPGVIVGTRNALLRVRVDGQTRTTLWHPTWRVTYAPVDGGAR